MSSSARRFNGSTFAAVAVSSAMVSLVAATAPSAHAASLGPGDIRALGATDHGVTSVA